MSALVRRFREKVFANVPRDRDAYHAEIRRRLAPGMTLLDTGCGKGRLNPFPWSEFPEVRLIGLDPDPEAEVNEAIDEFHLLEPGKPWAVADASVDLVICRYVLEHVEEPGEFLAEVKRVLKPGGEFVFLTPGKYYPVMVASAMMPHWLHQAILKRTKGSSGNDVFPTWYRMNTRGDLTRLAEEWGFEVVKLVQRDFQPADYFDFNAGLFLVNLGAFGIGKVTRADRHIGASILAVLRKAAPKDEGRRTKDPS